MGGFLLAAAMLFGSLMPTNLGHIHEPHCWPTDGPVTGWFGDWRSGGRAHMGIDIRAPRGQVIRAIEDGVVDDIRYSSTGGFIVELEHPDGSHSRYMHQFDKHDYWSEGYDATLARLPVKEGDRVATCQIIGYVGDSGNAVGTHLHFSYVSPGGWMINPLRLDWGGTQEPWPIFNWDTGAWSNLPEIDLRQWLTVFFGEERSTIMGGR